ncbi:MAG: molybdopterin-binding domain of aldehyde dehydrogenase family protein [Rubritepida sp.]|nr:molybdopterin-binding domain of aldehyde dehydrogenase family protein [Rubritepida sp.]
MFGQSIRRLEDDRFLRGQGRYMADLAEVPGTLQVYFLRSPHAHARIEAINVSAARAAPGVHLILTGEDLAAAGIGSLPCGAVLAAVRPLIIPPRPGLAQGTVRHVGQPVVCILAETRDQAQDASELIEVDYTPLDAVSCPHAALAEGAPQLHEEAPGNLAFLWHKGDRAAVDTAFAAAATVVEATIPNPRVTCAPIETRAALAVAEDGLLTLHCNGQNLHAIRAHLCIAMGMKPAEMRLVAPDIGGGFGVKNVSFPEHLSILHAARLTGRPVRWVAEIGEDFAAAAHGRGLHAKARLALDAEGRMLALDVDAVAEMGAYLSGSGPHCPTNAAATAMGGCYAIPAIHFTVRGAFSNTAPMEAYRGAGKPESNFIIEGLIEAAARQTGRDAHALRELNLIAAYPYRTAFGMEIREGDFLARLEECARLADRAGFPARRAASAARGKRRGFGLTCFLETARGAPGEWARLRATADGLVEVAVGTQSNGQGHETSFPQYISHLLDIPMEGIRYVQADTARIVTGNGHGGARSLHMGGEAMRQAAGALLAHARSVAARLLQSTPEVLHYEAGRFGLIDGRGMTLTELAAEEGPLEGEVTHALDLVTFPNGAHAAEVELDPETGEIRLLAYTAVDDYGRLLNPMLARGQVQGGVAQGIGQAMMERIAYDLESSQLLSAGFMDYAMPRAADLPDLDIHLREDQPTASNGLGVKGTGQAGCIAAPQAIVAALRDAVGAEVTMPATPEKLWRALGRG